MADGIPTMPPAVTSGAWTAASGAGVAWTIPALGKDAGTLIIRSASSNRSRRGDAAGTRGAMRDTLDLFARLGSDDHEITPTERRAVGALFRGLLATGSIEIAARLPDDWHKREQERQQREVIVALARLAASAHRFRSSAALAGRVEQQLGAYRASGWRHDAVYGLSPTANDSQRLMYAALAAGEGWFPTHETTRRWEDFRELVNETRAITRTEASNPIQHPTRRVNSAGRV